MIASRDQPGGDIDTKLSSNLPWNTFTMDPQVIHKDIDLYVTATLQKHPFTQLEAESRRLIIQKLVNTQNSVKSANGMYVHNFHYFHVLREIISNK